MDNAAAKEQINAFYTHDHVFIYKMVNRGS